MQWLAQAAGALVVAVTVADIFLTVLYARASTGLLTPRLNRGIWRLFRAAAPAGARGRDRVLSFAGPVIVAATVVAWVGLLLLGFALVYWPALGSGITASSGATPTGFLTALYVSGFSLTTLGTGDIAPATAGYRLLSVLQAGLGFSTLTLSLTYLMSVYTALLRRNVLAQKLHHLSGGTGASADLCEQLLIGGTAPDEARRIVAGLADDVIDLLEAHHSYPVLHYFRLRDPRYAFSRITLLAADTAALLQAARTDAGLATAAGTELLWRGTLNLVGDVNANFVAAERDGEFTHADRAAVAQRLAALRLPVDADRYLELRARWHASLQEIAAMMGYRWEEIEVAARAR